MTSMSKPNENKDTNITYHHNTSHTNHTMKKRATYGREIKAQALVLYSTGMSYRAIARLLKIPSHETIRLWIDLKAAQYDAQHSAQYYQENKERICQRTARYRKENKERISQRNAQYCQENKERIAQYQAQWNQENREHIAQQKAQYYQENRDKITQQRAQYRKQNPEKNRARASKRRADIRNATPPWFTEDHQRQIIALHAEAVRLERETGTPYHVDHIYPIIGKTVVDGKYQHTSCGLHVPWNMQVLPGPDNCSKNCRMPDPAIDPPTAW